MEPCSAFVDQNMDGQTVSQRNGASVLQSFHKPQTVHKIGLPILDAQCASNELSIDGTDLFSGSRTAKIYPDVDSSNENVFHSACRLDEQCAAVFLWYLP